MEKPTEKKLARAHVEVHLGNGKEPGPTAPTELATGATLPIELTAESRDLESWSA